MCMAVMLAAVAPRKLAAFVSCPICSDSVYASLHREGAQEYIWGHDECSWWWTRPLIELMAGRQMRYVP